MVELLWAPDPDVERWLEWAIDTIGPGAWAQRRTVHERFADALDAGMRGQATGTFADPIRPPDDRAGWYVYQAELYQRQPLRFDMPLCARIIPVIKRLGENLDVLRATPHARERLHRGLVVSPEEIDSVFFELLVAQAYATRGWDEVAFVSEDPAQPTPELVARLHGEPAPALLLAPTRARSSTSPRRGPRSRRRSDSTRVKDARPRNATGDGADQPGTRAPGSVEFAAAFPDPVAIVAGRIVRAPRRGSSDAGRGRPGAQLTAVVFLRGARSLATRHSATTFDMLRCDSSAAFFRSSYTGSGKRSLV